MARSKCLIKSALCFVLLCIIRTTHSCCAIWKCQVLVGVEQMANMYSAEGPHTESCGCHGYLTQFVSWIDKINVDDDQLVTSCDSSTVSGIEICEMPTTQRN